MSSSEVKLRPCRVAVCLSGQSRYWKECAENIKAYFNSVHPEGREVLVDYFIHTWDLNTWRLPKTGHGVFRNERRYDSKEIKAEFEPKAMEFEVWAGSRFPRAWDSMFYSFARSMLLRRDYELQNDILYDFVIKSRLDIVFNPLTKFPLDRIEPKACYANTLSNFPLEFNYTNFDDVIFYGDGPTMDLVGDLYHSYLKRHSHKVLEESEKVCNLDETSYYGPGTLLYDHMTNLGIRPEQRSTLDYAVMRSTAVENKFNPMTDYNLVKKCWRDWYI